jgi:hypothetical protein
MKGFAAPVRLSAVMLLGLALVLLAACQPLTSTEQPQPGTDQPQSEASTSTAVSQAESTSTTAGPTTTVGTGANPGATPGATPSATTTTTLPKPTPAQPLVTTTSLMLTEMTMATLPPDPWVRYEETDPNIAWTGGWMKMISSDASGGSFRAASSKAACRISFQGTRIQLVMIFGPDAGIAKLTLDNVEVTNYSFCFPQVFSMSAYAGPSLPFGNHTLLVEWTGQTDSLSGSNVISLDAVEVKGTLVK